MDEKMIEIQVGGWIGTLFAVKKKPHLGRAKTHNI